MNACHPAMRVYLMDFESSLGLPIRYQRWASRYEDKAAFRHELELVGPCTGLAAPTQVPYQGGVRTVTVTSSRPLSGEPVEIAIGDSTLAVAAVDGRRVRLAFDLERLFEAPEGDLQPGLVLESILKLALPKAADNIASYQWKDESARFVSWLSAGLDSQIAAWRQNIKDNDVELDRLTALAAGIVRKNRELRELLATVSSLTRGERDEQASKEFRDLVKMIPSPVESVDVEYGTLAVVLQPMSLQYFGCDYELGQYTLRISADNVRIWSDRGLRYPHPHVSSDGVPCWGSLGPHVARLLGERQYAGLIATIVGFLSSYNERDAYRRIETWDPDYTDDD